MAVVSKDVVRVLRCNNYRLDIIATGFANQRRNFTGTNTCQKHGAVPKFTETSSPELQTLLSTFRENVFLPAHLAKSHRKLIFGKRFCKSLEDNPVVVDIAGEQFRLKHIDRTKDIPRTTRGLLDAVALMKDKQDWDNLPVLLEGLKTAGKVAKQPLMEALVRKAGLAGRQDVILECARRVSRTGFVIKNEELAREVMFWIQYKALNNDWMAKETKRALSMAEQIFFLLEDERHSGGTWRRPDDPRVCSVVIGTLLQLAAAQAKLSGGKDEDGKVETYAKRLLGTLAGGSSLRKIFPSDDDPNKSYSRRSLYLRMVSPIIHGMKGAVELLDPGSKIVKQLKERESALSVDASTERELISQTLPEGLRLPLGAWCYDKLFGLAAS